MTEPVRIPYLYDIYNRCLQYKRLYSTRLYSIPYLYNIYNRKFTQPAGEVIGAVVALPIPPLLCTLEA